MPYGPNVHHRRSIRLRGYDYSRAGVYFVTICAAQRACLFGDIVDDTLNLSHLGILVARQWESLPSRFAELTVDAFVVMPNHLHGLLVLPERGSGNSRALPRSRASDDAEVITCNSAQEESRRVRRDAVPAPSAKPARRDSQLKPTLGQIITFFKYQSTKAVNEVRGQPGVPIWQRNYYDHVVRDEAALHRLREYTLHNPSRWRLDQLHPYNPSKW